MDRADTVRLFESVVIPTVDNTGETATARETAHVDDIAAREHVAFDFFADFVSGNIVKAEFFQYFFDRAGRFAVSELRLVEFALGDVLETDLNGCVAVALLRLDLRDDA